MGEGSGGGEGQIGDDEEEYGGAHGSGDGSGDGKLLQIFKSPYMVASFRKKKKTSPLTHFLLLFSGPHTPIEESEGTTTNEVESRDSGKTSGSNPLEGTATWMLLTLVTMLFSSCS